MKFKTNFDLKIMKDFCTGQIDRKGCYERSNRLQTISHKYEK